MKNLATPSSIFIFISSSSTGVLCSQPIRGNVHRIGRRFPEHVERSFLDPEYSFVAVRRILRTIIIREAKVRPLKNHAVTFAEYSQLFSRTNVRPIKNGLKTDGYKLLTMSMSRFKIKRRFCVRVCCCFLRDGSVRINLRFWPCCDCYCIVKPPAMFVIFIHSYYRYFLVK